uniref:Enolase 2 n=1 Tax=Molossus molossus TaxID=27622 RepID=A0A7J8FWQ8_MOLMO|nr:enolase 2 [Molossus molossus]
MVWSGQPCLTETEESAGKARGSDTGPNTQEESVSRVHRGHTLIRRQRMPSLAPDLGIQHSLPLRLSMGSGGFGRWAEACVGSGKGRLWVAPSPSPITFPQPSPITPPTAPNPHSYVRLRPRLLTHRGLRVTCARPALSAPPPARPPPAAREPQSPPPPPPLPLSLRRCHCRHCHRHRLSLLPRGEAPARPLRPSGRCPGRRAPA